MHRKIKRYTVLYRKNQRMHVRRARRAARHPFAVPFFTIIILAVMTGGFYALLHQGPASISPDVVVISHDGTQQIVSSKEPNVGALLTKLRIKLNQGDVVEPALTTLIKQDDFRINIYRAQPVAIVDGIQKDFVFSAATTSRQVAREAGLKVYPEDTVTAKPVTDFTAGDGIGQELVIDPATPVNVDLYGAPVILRTHAGTVRGLLAERKIILKPQDIVTPGLDAPLSADTQLAIIRNGVSTLTQQQDIPAPVQIIYDASLSYGVSAVRQQGTPGKAAVIYAVTTQNGKEVSRIVVQTTVISQPVTQIVVQGTNLGGIKGDMALAGIAPGDYSSADYIISHESGWCPTKAQGQIGSCPVYSGSVPSYGGYGLCQSTPGGKMASAGADWATNPVTQLKWCAGYANSRYGSWSAAYSHWTAYHNW